MYIIHYDTRSHERIVKSEKGKFNNIYTAYMFFISSTIFVFLAAALLLKKRKDEISHLKPNEERRTSLLFVEM
jgi:hypothetical protein